MVSNVDPPYANGFIAEFEDKFVETLIAIFYYVNLIWDKLIFTYD